MLLMFFFFLFPGSYRILFQNVFGLCRGSLKSHGIHLDAYLWIMKILWSTIALDFQFSFEILFASSSKFGVPTLIWLIINFFYCVDIFWRLSLHYWSFLSFIYSFWVSVENFRMLFGNRLRFFGSTWVSTIKIFIGKCLCSSFFISPEILLGKFLLDTEIF